MSIKIQVTRKEVELFFIDSRVVVKLDGCQASDLTKDTVVSPSFGAFKNAWGQATGEMPNVLPILEFLTEIERNVPRFFVEKYGENVRIYGTNRGEVFWWSPTLSWVASDFKEIKFIEAYSARGERGLNEIVLKDGVPRKHPFYQ